MSKILFPDKLYIPNIIQSRTPQRGPGNKKVISYELTLKSNNLTEKDFDKFKALYKLQGILDIDSSSYKLANRNIYELTTDVIIATPFCGNSLYLIYPKYVRNNEYHPDWLYSHYIISNKNILNSNSKSISNKRANSLALNKKIASNSQLISSYTANEITLNIKYIRKLLNIELQKFGKKVSANTTIIL